MRLRERTIGNTTGRSDIEDRKEITLREETLGRLTYRSYARYPRREKTFRGEDRLATRALRVSNAIITSGEIPSVLGQGPP